jgi:WD40 repeat protein
LLLAFFLVSLPLVAFADNSTKKERTDRYGDPLPKGSLMRLGTLRFCQPFPWCIAFSPDGKVLASGGYDNRIRLWNPDTGKELRVLEGHKSFVNCIAFSADGKWLASGSQDSTLCLWEVETGKVTREFQGHKSPIERMTLSPDGKVLRRTPPTRRPPASLLADGEARRVPGSGSCSPRVPCPTAANPILPPQPTPEHRRI